MEFGVMRSEAVFRAEVGGRRSEIFLGRRLFFSSELGVRRAEFFLGRRLFLGRRSEFGGRRAEAVFRSEVGVRRAEFGGCF